jgi:hypothetical protein
MMDKPTDLQLRTRLVPLGSWLQLAARVGVPYVRAKFSEPFPVCQIYDALDRKDTPELSAAFKWLSIQVIEAETYNRRISARWECCSSQDAKYAASKGEEWSKEYYLLTCDDERVGDCTVGCTETRLCVRPWIEAERIDGYPVEFRVFHGPGGDVLGVSNYYPQRALPDTLQIFQKAAAVAYWSAMLYERSTDYAREALDQGFTTDWIVGKDGGVVFLEGGPPHVEGPVTAHPCCFALGKVAGIALAARAGAIR